MNENQNAIDSGQVKVQIKIWLNSLIVKKYVEILNCLMVKPLHWTMIE